MVQTNIGASVTIATVPEKYSRRITQTGTSDELQATIAHLRQKLTRLFDLETETHELITRQISELSDRLRHAELDQKYRRMDMSFMKMGQTPPGWSCVAPKFAIFSLQSGICRVRLTTHLDAWNERPERVSVESSPSVAAELCDLSSLTKLHERNQSLLPRRSWLTSWIESKFKGAIPDEIRDQITKARSQFTDVFLVCDAQWVFGTSVEVVPLPPPPAIDRDPLVIGKKDGQYWLVAQFDTTPAELYAASEFTH